MNETTIDLGNGVTINTNSMTTASGLGSTGTLIPGPQPMQAASPPPPPPPTKKGPPGAGGGGDQGPSESSETTTLDSLDKRVSALEDAMSQVVEAVNQMMGQMAASAEAAMAAIEAKATPLPPLDDACPHCGGTGHGPFV